MCANPAIVVVILPHPMCDVRCAVQRVVQLVAAARQHTRHQRLCAADVRQHHEIPDHLYLSAAAGDSLLAGNSFHNETFTDNSSTGWMDPNWMLEEVEMFAVSGYP